MNQKYLPHFNIVIAPLHPKRPSAEELMYLAGVCDDADILDFEYWKSAMRALKEFPHLAAKKKILAHHNPYDLAHEKWNEIFDVTIAKNQEIKEALPYSEYINIPVDNEYFVPSTYNEKSNIVLMVANRIESKKGILEVAKACSSLHLRFVLIGAVSDKAYFDSIMQQGAEFHESIPDEELLNWYRKAALHVCNSEDGFESGTMPMLEAFAAGCPVLTRLVGHVPDFYNGKNCFLNNAARDDIDSLTDTLVRIMKDPDARKKVRAEGFRVARTYSARRAAWKYEKLFYNLNNSSELVSVVIPTHERHDMVIENIMSLKDQTYKNFEVVVVEDTNEESPLPQRIKDLGLNIPIKYYKTNKCDSYNLGYARNLGAIMASGEYLVFLDDRQCMEGDALSKFMVKKKQHTFMFGIKDGIEKGFVENFSFINRREFIDAGMFAVGFPYGFLSQETRARFVKQGFTLQRVDEAKARTLSSTHNRSRKLLDINLSKDLLYKMGNENY